MSIDTLQPATDNELELVLRVAPDLIDAGFGSYYRQEEWNRSRRGLPLVERSPSIPITDPRERKGIAVTRLFLRKNVYKTPVINRALSSLILSHEATHWFDMQHQHQYPLESFRSVSNGAFIAGAILEGYTIDIDGPSAYFPLSLSPRYEQLRQLKADMEAIAGDRLAWKAVAVSS